MTERKILKNWDDLRIFMSVARTGSYTLSSHELELVQTTVGRRIANLEQQLGGRLFERHRSGVRLTQRGLEIFEKAKFIEGALNDFDDYLANSADLPVGDVQIACTEGIATYWLIPRLQSLQAMNPDIRIRLVPGGADALSRGELDVMIGYARPQHANIVGKRIGLNHFAIYASESYVEKNGRPDSLDAMRQHQLIDNLNYKTNEALAPWRALVSDSRRVLTATSVTALAAVRSGMGIGLLPTFFEAVAPELVRLQAPMVLSSEIFLLSREGARSSKRVAITLDFLTRCFRDDAEHWFN